MRIDPAHATRFAAMIALLAKHGEHLPGEEPADWDRLDPEQILMDLINEARDIAGDPKYLDSFAY